MEQLTELEQRILSELEEAGEESVLTLALTVLDGAGTHDELEALKVALTNLTTAQLVRMSASRGLDRRLTELSSTASISAIETINSFLRFDLQKSRWSDIRRSGPPFSDEFPYVVATDSGKNEGFQILDKRGYQWWRPRKT